MGMKPLDAAGGGSNDVGYCFESQHTHAKILCTRAWKHLGNVWSLQLAFGKARPIEIGKPWVHLHIRSSPLERAQPLVGILDQEALDDVSQILHVADLPHETVLQETQMHHVIWQSRMQ